VSGATADNDYKLNPVIHDGFVSVTAQPVDLNAINIKIIHDLVKTEKENQLLLKKLKGKGHKRKRALQYYYRALRWDLKKSLLSHYCLNSS